MQVQNYKPRIVDSELKRRLKSVGAIVIEGAKWCGKSTTAEFHSSSAIFIDEPGRTEQYELFAQENPNLILDGETPRLIDEWQLIPEIWDAVRFKVNHRYGMGQFLLTGSAKPAEREKIKHSGTGRFAWMRMRPMSLYESGESNGKLSLHTLFETQTEFEPFDVASDLEEIAIIICRGGWPVCLDLPLDVRMQPAIDYFSAVVNVDISDVLKTSVNPERARLLMRSYARFQGTQTPISTIIDDVNGSGTHLIDEKLARCYIDTLRSMFVIEDMPAWNPNLKSKTAIRTTETRYFVDPSIAVAALGIGPGDLMNDLKTFGFLFETLCIRDLRVYMQNMGGTVYHYRDKNGLECDAIVHLPNGEYGLIEIKLGGERQIEDGVSNLNKFADRLDFQKMKTPSFRMVLTAVGKYGYKRKDGIIVAPIRSLAP